MSVLVQICSDLLWRVVRSGIFRRYRRKCMRFVGNIDRSGKVSGPSLRTPFRGLIALQVLFCFDEIFLSVRLAPN